MNNSDYYAETISIIGVNIGIGFFATVLNFVVFTVFITSKELRYNLFYRLFFVIHLFQLIGSFVIIVQYWIYLNASTIKFACTFVSVLGSVTRIASITQTGIVAFDRFQASLRLPKSVLHKRRSKLGKVSVCMCFSVFFLFCIIGGIYGTDNCTSKQWYGQITGTVSQMTACWIVICVFVVQIPLCIATFYNIRKICTTVKVTIQLDYMRSNIQEDKLDRNLDKFPTPTVQGNIKFKMQALRVLSLLVTTYAVIFIPQIFIMILARGTDNHREKFYDYGIFLQGINYLVDPIICLLTVKPYREAFNVLFIKFLCCK